MPLSGSDVAYKQARSGIARSGATRSGFFTPNVVVTINSVDRTSSVIMTSLSVSLVLNDEVDTARFTLEPGATIPTVGQSVSVCLGSSSNPIFAGQIARVSHRRLRKAGASNFNVFVDVECIDWMKLFDRTIVNATYTSESATFIINALVSGASGFTSNFVEADLPTIDYIAFTNEQRSKAVRRVIAAMGGGGFYIAPDRDVHAFGPDGDTSIGSPQSLTNTSVSLQSFTHSYDYSQVRNRVVVEGQTVPAAVDHVTGASSLIVESGANDFDLSGGRIRVGTKRYGYTNFKPFLQTDAGVILGAEGVTSGTAALGATTIPVADTTEFDPGGAVFYPLWLKIDGQYISYFSVSTPSGAGNITGIPASGFGSITVPIASGTAVYSASYFWQLLDYETVTDTVVLDDTVKKGDQIALIVQDDDTTSQTAIAAIEGGDGIHEHVISDGRLSVDGAALRAQAELDAFKDPLTHVSYTSDDMGVMPGAAQVINLTTTDAFSDTLTVTHVDLTFPVNNYRPQRQCQASTVRLARFADIAETEET